MSHKRSSTATPNDSKSPAIRNSVGPQRKGSIGASSHGATTSNVVTTVPRGILTFRTLISMLALSQREKFELEKSPSDTLLPDDIRRQELKFCSAFAAVAVMKTEVVSVVTKTTTDAVQVIVYAQYTKSKTSPTRQDPLPIVANTEPANRKNHRFGSFTFTINPEWGAKNPPRTVSLDDVEDLCDWEGGDKTISDEKILEYIAQAR